MSQLRARKIRPTGKGVFCDKRGNVLLIHKDGKVSFPGGGVDKGETLPKAIARENREELKGFTITLRTLRNAKILISGILETTKLEWKKKKVYVIVINARHLEDITPNDEEHTDFKVLPIAEAIAYIQNHEGTLLKSRKFYVAALRKLAKLKKWKI